jgi:hypothetical protein
VTSLNYPTVVQSKQLVDYRRRVLIFALTATVALALGLRLWGIQFGLPYLYHYDENFYVTDGLEVGAGKFSAPPYTATGFSNLLFLEYATVYVIGKVTGLFTTAQDLEAFYRTDPSLFYLLGRLTTALFGTATVLVAYWLGNALRNERTGMVAAGLLAVTFLHVRDSHYAVPDIAMSFFAFAAATTAIIAMKRRRPNYLYAASVLGGIAVAMKWTALPVLFPLLLVSSGVVDILKKQDLRLFLFRSTLISIFLFVAGFFFASPQILINPAPYLGEVMKQYQAGQGGGFEVWQVDTAPGWIFYAKTLAYGFGLLPLTLAVIGLTGRLYMVVRERDGISVVFLSFPLVYFAAMGSTNHYFARYALPLIPFLVVAVAEAIDFADMHWKRKVIYPSALFGLFVGVILIQPLASSLRHNQLLTREDTRTEAKQWIETHIPAGTKIALDWRGHTPSLSISEFPMPYSAREYDAYFVGGTGLSGHSLAWYREHGFEYLVASSFIYRIPLVSQAKNRERDAFYEVLEEELQLIHIVGSGEGDLPFIFDEIYGPAISVWQREQPGPEIRIYRLD